MEDSRNPMTEGPLNFFCDDDNIHNPTRRIWEMAQGLVCHITDLTRRLAEVEAKKNAWKEQAIKIQHDLETICERLINAEGKVKGLQADSKDAYANYAKSGRESYARLRRAEASEATVANLEGELQRMRQAMGGYKP